MVYDVQKRQMAGGSIQGRQVRIPGICDCTISEEIHTVRVTRQVNRVKGLMVVIRSNIFITTRNQCCGIIYFLKVLVYNTTAHMTEYRISKCNKLSRLDYVIVNKVNYLYNQAYSYRLLISITIRRLLRIGNGVCS